MNDSPSSIWNSVWWIPRCHGIRVARELDAFIQARERPLMVVSNIRTESGPLRRFCQGQEDSAVEFHSFAPGKPMQTGVVE